MEAQNPLSDMADIHLPGEISWWPLAIGWWILIALILLAAGAGLVWWLAKQLQHRKMQSAMDELDAGWQQYQMEQAFSARNKGKAGIIFLNEINSILRRVALVHYPAEELAALHGKPWLSFLDECDNSNDFQQQAADSLGEALYRQSYDENPEAVYTLARRWIIKRYGQLKLLEQLEKPITLEAST